jgi:shikimate 5-dehydrogenase/shikimate kinase/3-dehydroquinate dehydratase
VHTGATVADITCGGEALMERQAMTHTRRRSGESAHSFRSGASKFVDVKVGGHENALRPAYIKELEWNPNASILLLGIRGTGNTSLGILAASCIGFRLVDAQQEFFHATGVPRSAYAAKHGAEEYRKFEVNLMRSLLSNNPKRCIIVCGPGSAEETGQELLRQSGKHHPIIQIMRDPLEIEGYLKTNNPGKITQITELVDPSYRSLSHFEFYNLCEPRQMPNSMTSSSAATTTQVAPDETPAYPRQYLTLKHVEEDFSRLILAIRSQRSRPRSLYARHTLSFLPPESKPFTYAVTVPIDFSQQAAARLRETDFVADAVKLALNLDTLLPNGKALDHGTSTYITKKYYTLRRNVKLPVIFHVQSSNPGNPPEIETEGLARTWNNYINVLSHGLRLAPEYLTLNLETPPDLAHQFLKQQRSGKVIGSFHDGLAEPGAWDSTSRLDLIRTAEAWDCDLVMISQQATSQADNLALQRFVHRAMVEGLDRLPLIAYNLGRDGRGSCFSNSILTPVTHDLFRMHQPSDSLLTVQAAQNALYASFTLDPLTFGIFGSSVSAALSPAMHNAAFRYCGMPHRYHVFQRSTLRQIEDIVRDENFGGASISSPFKKEVFAVVDYASPEAQAIGAVNTLIPLRSSDLQTVVDRNHAGPVKALFGDNTDWIGVHSCVQQNLSPVNAVKGRTTALILGAGGMAQAAVYAAIRLGVKTIFIHNRTLARAKHLASQFHGKSYSLHNIDLLKASPRASVNGGDGSVTPEQQVAGPASIYTIESKNEPWPSGFDPPTIIVSCVKRIGENDQPPANNSVPASWLTSPTGGVVIEVRPLKLPARTQDHTIHANPNTARVQSDSHPATRADLAFKEPGLDRCHRLASLARARLCAV